MKRLAIAATAVFVLSPFALADKYYLGSQADADKMAEGSSPDVVEGVLLDEDDGYYHIRVVGGEIRLAKSRVYKVEKDALTVDAVVRLEQDQAERLAIADAERQQVQAVEASARASMRDRRATEAAMTREVEPAPLPAVIDGGFDPVLGIALSLNDADQLRQITRLYKDTGDPRLRKIMRQMRRMR